MLAAGRFHIVTGKGGVGKTTVATALAMAEARAGKEVLLAEAHGRDQVATMLGVRPVGPNMREVLERLHVVDMTAEEAIHEYALLTLRFEALYRAVFQNRFVRSFLRLIPSLGELVMLGKLWYHEQEQREGRARFDAVVLDAPATGHALSMLRTPKAVEQTVPRGPLRNNARDIGELLSDAQRTRLHVVTIPEEMAVNEARRLGAAARDELQVALGWTFLNETVAPVPPPVLEALAGHRADGLVGSVHQALKLREDKREQGELQLEALPGNMLANAVRLPRLVGYATDRERIEALAEHFVRQQLSAHEGLG